MNVKSRWLMDRENSSGPKRIVHAFTVNPYWSITTERDVQRSVLAARQRTNYHPKPTPDRKT